MREDFNISDEEFEKEIKPFITLLNSHIENNIIPDYIAFYLSTKYARNVLWKATLNAHIVSAIDELCEVKSIDKEKIKKILKDKYSLEIISENPLQFKKID